MFIVFLLKLIHCLQLSAAEVTLLENNIIIYKFVQDLHFFVTGGEDENELILASVLQGFFDAVTLLLRYFWLYLLSGFKTWCVFTDHALCLFLCMPFTGAMVTKERHLRTWISFSCVLTRLLMEGMHIFLSQFFFPR